VRKADANLTEAAAFPVKVGDKTSKVRLLDAGCKGVRLLFVDEPRAFDRPGLYGDGRADFPDNAERFILFCRAALAGLSRTGIRPDVIHCHDWQTALVPLFLKERRPKDPAFARTRTVLTIHNLGYQGNFPEPEFKLLGVPDRLFSAEGVEFFGSVSFLKAGLLFADKLTTVSPTYAEEIQTKILGCGMEGVLRARKDDLVGILNGIDTEIWNPATDPNLSRAVDAGSPEDKLENKARLAEELGLRSDGSCLLGCVTRLAGQKGIDKIIERIPELVSAGARVAILGTGAPEYEDALRQLARARPDAVSTPARTSS
jgi:starch synthase